MKYQTIHKKIDALVKASAEAALAEEQAVDTRSPIPAIDTRTKARAALVRAIRSEIKKGWT